jgi:hypothetical protein
MVLLSCRIIEKSNGNINWDVLPESEHHLGANELNVVELAEFPELAEIPQ